MSFSKEKTQKRNIDNTLYSIIKTIDSHDERNNDEHCGKVELKHERNEPSVTETLKKK